MKIPKKIKIGGGTWDVLFPYIFKERTDTFGRCDANTQKIMLTNVNTTGEKLHEDKVVTYFLHELGHAIDMFTGHHVFYGVEGEKILDAFSEAVYMFLVDNGMIKRETKMKGKGVKK